MRAIKKKQRTDTKKDANWIRSDNFTRSNREKLNIAIAILEKWMIAIIFSPTVCCRFKVEDRNVRLNQTIYK